MEIRVQAVPLNFKATEERLAQKAREDLIGVTTSADVSQSDDQVIQSYVNAMLDRHKFIEIFNEVHREVVSESGDFILGSEPLDSTSWIGDVAQEVTTVLHSGLSSPFGLRRSQVWTPESVQARIEDVRVPGFGSPPVDFMPLIEVLTTHDRVIHLALYRHMNPQCRLAYF